MTSDSDASDTLPLILFSGLAADANVLIPQKLAFPQLFVPEWPTPLKGESMPAYCERIADELRSQGPCVIGGASFGGVIAQEVCQWRTRDFVDTSQGGQRIHSRCARSTHVLK